MSFRREPEDESYDVIVVGGGIGGLTAGALLAKAGKRVLVVERHNVPGGYAHGFRRGKYFFDGAAHAVSACEPVAFGDPAFLDYMLRLLAVRDNCAFLPVEPLYTAVYPDFRLTAPSGIDTFIEAHLLEFPGEKGLRRLLRAFTKINREYRLLPSDIRSYAEARATGACPTLDRYHDATLQEALDEFLTDPRLKQVLSTFWPYLGLPPSRLSVMAFSSPLMSYVHTGMFYCQGGLQNLAGALAGALEANGGELLLRASVRRILVEDGRVCGVALEHGQRIRAPAVVSSMDALQTFEELVGSEHLPAPFLQAIRRMKPSLSAVMLFMATDLDLAAMGVAHESFVYRSFDHDENYRMVLAGEPAALIVSVPTLVDSTLAPPGHHLVTVTAPMPYDIAASWRREKDAYAEKVMDVVEQVIPGLRGRLLFFEGASPRTMERYTLNLAGAMYGWERSPEQSGANRLPRVTPLPGLFLAGHWTQPGSGVLLVMASGALTAQVLLGYPDFEGFMRALNAPL